MKTYLIIIISLFTFPSFGQIITIWKGNCPGQQHKWECPQNWSTSTVPDKFSDVVIPLDISEESHYPKISGNAEINSLHIWPGATLTINLGQLKILDASKSVFRRHQVIGKGTIKHPSNEVPALELLANKGTQ